MIYDIRDQIRDLITSDDLAKALHFRDRLVNTALITVALWLLPMMVIIGIAILGFVGIDIQTKTIIPPIEAVIDVIFYPWLIFAAIWAFFGRWIYLALFEIAPEFTHELFRRIARVIDILSFVAICMGLFASVLGAIGLIGHLLRSFFED